MATLRIVTGPAQGQSFQLDGESVIGRDPSCAIAISSPDISRRHCKICPDEEGYRIEDLESRNGTRVNGNRVACAVLCQGDTIALGGTRALFIRDAGEGVAADADAVLLDSTDRIDVTLTLDASEISHVFEPDDDSVSRQRLQAFYRVTQALAVHEDENETFREILQCLLDIFPQASRAFLLMGNEVGNLTEKGRLNRHAIHRGDDSLRISRTIARTVLESREAVLSTDATSDDRFAGGMSIVQQQIRSMMCTPLIAKNEVLGILQVDSHDILQPFDRDDLDLLLAVAAQVALFLRNIELARRATEERERRRHLERFFSPEVARKVIRDRMELGGELRDGVILFCDIVGFTQMSERLDAHELVNRLNRYFTLMVDVIRLDEGTVDKFGGDAILAVWGAPTDVTEDARHALEAAVAMQNSLVHFNGELTAQGSEPIRMGIGLHAGPFIAGNIGSASRMEYTIIGREVNIAQRIESTASAGMIMASDDFCARAGDGVLGRRIRDVTLKGAAGVHSVVCIRGYRQPDGYTLSIPTHLADGREARIHRADTDGCTLELVTAELPAEGEAIHLSCDTPERPGDVLDAVVLWHLPDRPGHCEVRTESTPCGLRELIDQGIVDGGHGIPWQRSA